MSKSIAVVSTALPPSASGQGRVLERLLRDRADIDYWFMSDNETTFPNKSEEFGRYIRLAPQEFGLSRRNLSGWVGAINRRLGYRRPIWLRAAEIGSVLGNAKPCLLIGCSGSPFDLAASALAARRAGTRFIAYLFDDPLFQWASEPMRAIARRLEPGWASIADPVICPNEVLAGDFKMRTGKAAVVIRNPVDDDKAFQSALERRAIEGRPIRILYTGSVYEAQGDAFANLVRAMSLTPGKYRLEVYTSQPQSAFESNGLWGRDVVRREHVSSEDIAKQQRDADILFLPLAFHSKIQPVLMSASPAKTAEYLLSGRPVLVHAPRGSFVSEFFRRTGAGYVVDQPSPVKLAQALLDLELKPELCLMFTAAARVAAREFSVSEARSRFWNCVSCDRSEREVLAQ